jgi:TRAP-type C4-dicarboxylate transport system permease large subunit
MLSVPGCLVAMPPSISITIQILPPIVTKFSVDPAISNDHAEQSGNWLCHPRVGATLFVGCAVGRIRMKEVMKQFWPFYGLVFLALMPVTYVSARSLWLPHLLKL